MEDYFSKYREGIIRINTSIPTVDGQKKKILYADWAATGRNYAPIELRIQENIMPLISNIEGEASTTIPNTYGYDLVMNHLDKKKKNSDKLFWIRLSLHPTMTMQEIRYIGNSIDALATKHKEWLYPYSSKPCEDFPEELENRINATLKHNFVSDNQATILV